MVDRVGDGAARAGQLAQQRVAVEQAERARNLVLLLEHQPVQRPPGDVVQHVPRVDDLVVGGPHLGPGRGGDPRRRDGLDGVHVPLPAACLLEVGLEQEGELAVQPGPLVVQRLELGEPGAGVGAPVLERALAQPGGQVGVAGHVPGVQQAERDLEVAAGHPARLRHGPDGVVEVRARVPHRVPDPVGDPRDVIAAVVQQQHVEVAARQQLLAAVAAHRDQGDPGLRAEQPGQPAVGVR